MNTQDIIDEAMRQVDKAFANGLQWNTLSSVQLQDIQWFNPIDHHAMDHVNGFVPLSDPHAKPQPAQARDVFPARAMRD